MVIPDHLVLLAQGDSWQFSSQSRASPPHVGPPFGAPSKSPIKTGGLSAVGHGASSLALPLAPFRNGTGPIDHKDRVANSTKVAAHGIIFSFRFPRHPRQQSLSFPSQARAQRRLPFDFSTIATALGWVIISWNRRPCQTSEPDSFTTRESPQTVAPQRHPGSFGVAP